MGKSFIFVLSLYSSCAACYLQAEWEFMDASCECADFPVRQHLRVIGVDLIEDLRHVELLQRAHQEVEIREGELHVLRVAHTMA